MAGRDRSTRPSSRRRSRPSRASSARRRTAPRRRARRRRKTTKRRSSRSKRRLPRRTGMRRPSWMRASRMSGPSTSGAARSCSRRGSSPSKRWRRDVMTTHSSFEGLEGLRPKWGWFLLLGIALIVLGAVALAAPWLTTLTSVLLYGWLLVFGGVFEVVAAFWATEWRGIFLHLL